jgi:lysozyme
MDEKLSNQLIRDEGLKLKPYRCTANKLTIAIGRNLDDVGLTKEEALYLLANDIKRCKDDLDRTVPWWTSLNEPRQRALVNMCFNLGITRLLGFKQFLGALKAGDYQRAALEAKDSAWYRQVGDRAKRIVESVRTGTD